MPVPLVNQQLAIPYDTRSTSHHRATLPDPPRPRVSLSGGYECDVWRVASDHADVVVRISPTWRTSEELAWTHDLTRFVVHTVPEVVAPLVAADRSTLFVHQQHPVALFPFVAGHPLDRERATMRENAARLLARLHRAMLRWPELKPRPPRGRSAPVSPAPADDPDMLLDPTLDTWYAALRERPRALRVGPIHGDYYRANLRCVGDRIAGVVDWDDSAVDVLIQEVAWATWEFCKAPAGDALLDDRARAFLAAYGAADGPAEAEENALVVPLIRWRLREEVRRHLAAAERGEAWDRVYMEGQVRAFQLLGACTFQ